MGMREGERPREPPHSPPNALPPPFTPRMGGRARLRRATNASPRLDMCHVQKVAPIPLKSHGRKAELAVRRGHDVLRQVFVKCAEKPIRVARKTHSMMNRKSGVANRSTLSIISRC